MPTRIVTPHFPYLGVEDHAKAARAIEGEDRVGQNLHVRVVAVRDHLVPGKKIITIHTYCLFVWLNSPTAPGPNRV